MTTHLDVVINSNMNAVLMLNERHLISESASVEIVVWRLPPIGAASRHRFKYRLALLVNGDAVLRYDNETGKGDHMHIGKIEVPYAFTTVQALLDDFWNDVEKWRV